METWRKRVEAELKGADFTRTLVDRAYAGVDVGPVYSAQDPASRPQQTDVDLAPYLRGTRPPAEGPAWCNMPRYDLPHPAALRSALLEDLAGGCDGLLLQLDACARLGAAPQSPLGREAWGDGGCMLWTLEDWRQAFEGVHLEMVQLHLDAGANTLASLTLLLALLEERGIDPSGFAWHLGFDPLGALARDGSLPMGAKCMKDQCGDLMRWTSQHMPAAKVFTVSTETYHRTGATLVQELGILAATLVHYLQLAEGLGFAPEVVARSTSLRLAMDRDLFPAIAGQRVARRLWSRILSACGLETIPAPSLHAVGSRRSLARRDPWTNALRASTQTFAAILGGAEAITTCAFDETLGRPSTLGRRVARNTQVILAEESRLGDVCDPGGGAFLIEELTASLSREAWAFFQEIEGQGGVAQALRSGWLGGRLQEQQATRRAAVATRRIAVTGVSSFPPLEEPAAGNLPYLGSEEEEHVASWEASDPCVVRAGQVVEDLQQAARDGADLFALTAAQRAMRAASCAGPEIEPLLPMRDAEVFEETCEAVGERLHAGDLPPVRLVPVGSESQAEPRLGFAEALFRSVDWPTERGAPESGAVVCLCGSDAAYGGGLSAALEQAKSLGVQRILVAGRGMQDAPADVTWVHLRSDVPALVARLLEARA